MMKKTAPSRPTRTAPVPKNRAVTEAEIDNMMATSQWPADRPAPSQVRGLCPQCGEVLVSNLYYVQGQGYLLCWECWRSLGEHSTCRYRRVL